MQHWKPRRRPPSVSGHLCSHCISPFILSHSFCPASCKQLTQSHPSSPLSPLSHLGQNIELARRRCIYLTTPTFELKGPRIYLIIHHTYNLLEIPLPYMVRRPLTYLVSPCPVVTLKKNDPRSFIAIPRPPCFQRVPLCCWGRVASFDLRSGIEIHHSLRPVGLSDAPK